eukprot:TRINITY_DN5852_c0_g1_i4.p1 TRINITY_DN5852_c0_g1~~TRINITY_DN5852_c0_g1_i4.p1  ORF type:complete len:1487 (-),score=359.46 TRINITY_DN5852_c0_g1_i4:2702-7138(-)
MTTAETMDALQKREKPRIAESAEPATSVRLQGALLRFRLLLRDGSSTAGDLQASFAVRDLRAEAFFYRDGAVMVHAQLSSLHLKNCREQLKSVNRDIIVADIVENDLDSALFHNIDDSDAEGENQKDKNNIMSFEFVQDAAGARSADVVVQSLFFFILPSALLEILNFFFLNAQSAHVNRNTLLDRTGKQLTFDQVAVLMRAANGVACVANEFKAEDAVAWARERLQLSQDESLELLEQLLARGYLRGATPLVVSFRENPTDAFCFEDEQPPPSASAAAGAHSGGACRQPSCSPPTFVSVSLRNVQLTVYEDELRHDSRCVEIGCSLAVECRRVSEALYSRATLQKAKIAVCQLLPQNRSCPAAATNVAARYQPGVSARTPMVYVLNPVEATAEYNLLLAGYGRPLQQSTAAVRIQPVLLYLSYRDITLFAKVIYSMYVFRKVCLPLARHILPKLGVSGKVPAACAEVPNIKFYVDCSSTCFTLIDDTSRRGGTPFMELRIADFVGVALRHTNSENMQLAVNARAALDYFNDSLMCFEPFIEYWSFEIQFITGGNPSYCLLYKTTTPINVNLSSSLLGQLPCVAAAVTRQLNEFGDVTGAASIAVAGASAAAGSDTAGFVQCLNKCGLPVEVFLRGAGAQGEGKGIVAQPSQSVPLHLTAVTSSIGRKLYTTAHTVDVQLFGSDDVLHDIMVDIVGCDVRGTSLGVPLIAEVTCLGDGGKLLTLRSHVLVTNNLGVPLVLKLENRQEKATVIVDPGATETIPLMFAGGRLRARPESATLKSFHESLNLCDLPKTQEVLVRTCEPKELSVPTQCHLALTVVRDQKILARFGYTQTCINFYPPLKLTNLLPYPLSYSGPAVSKVKGVAQSGECVPVFEFYTEHDVYLRFGGLPGFSDFGYRMPARPGKKTHEQVAVEDEQGRKLLVTVETTYCPTREIMLYAPFWVVNKSYLKLQYLCVSVKGDSMAAGPTTEDDFPFIFSAPRMRLKTEDATKWSNTFTVDAVGTAGVIDVLAAGATYCLKVVVSPGTGKFSRVRCVVISPRFVLVNRLPHTLIWRQLCDQPDVSPASPTNIAATVALLSESGNSTISAAASGDANASLAINARALLMAGVAAQGAVRSGSVCPLHFPPEKVTRERLISVCVNNTLVKTYYEWSGKFSLVDVGDFAVRCCSSDPSVADFYVNVNVTDESGSIFVIFTEGDDDNPPFIIDNQTVIRFTFNQKGSSKRFKVDPGTSAAFTWDIPAGETVLEMLSKKVLPKPQSFNIAKIKAFQPITPRSFPGVYPFVKLEGTTRVFVLTHDHKQFLDYASLADSGQKQGVQKSGGYKEEQQKVFAFAAEVGMLGVSVIDATPQELIYATVNRVVLLTEYTGTELNFELKAGDVQVDNMAFEPEFPVIVQSVLKDPQKPWLHVSCVKSTVYNKLDYFTYFSALMQELDVRIESNFVQTCFYFVDSLPLPTLKQIMRGVKCGLFVWSLSTWEG